MKPTRPAQVRWPLLVMIPIVMLGCRTAPDEQVRQTAKEACDPQAQQNQVIARQTEDAAKLTTEVLDAERQRAPVVAEAVRFAAGLIVGALPLVVVIYLLSSLRSGQQTDAADTRSAAARCTIVAMSGRRRMHDPAVSGGSDRRMISAGEGGSRRPRVGFSGWRLVSVMGRYR